MKRSSFRALLLVVCAGVPSLAFAGLSVRFETGGVVVSGATRGGSVASLFADQIPQQWKNGSVVHRDTDGDGEVLIAIAAGLSKRTVWAAVDVETGEFTVGSPQGPVAEIGFRGHTLKVNSAGQLKRLETVDGESRPREGAWTLRSGDGTKTDADGEDNQHFELDVESLEPLPGYGPPPKRFEKGDVIIILDPHSGAVFATTVGGK
jgi:hypothetical protein